MSGATRQPFFSLPGFFPDALPYALRTAASLLLAYGVSFYAQIPSASSAGITVGIIAQASTGMALSKAFYRVLGTIVGCAVALVLGASFGQDRTMLLMTFALWMGVCAGVATLLRDFRSYGAAISGYTVAIIAVGGIDAPEGLVLASLNRTAAILIGIASVALVNSLFGGVSALGQLTARLRAEQERVTAFALDALEGRPIADDLEITRRVANITGLQSDASHAAAEHPRGWGRQRGAQVAIGSMLTAVSAGRTIAGLRSPATPEPVRAYLAAAAAHLRTGEAMPPPPPVTQPDDALLVERANALVRRMDDAQAGIRVLEGGEAALPDVVLRPTQDLPAAFIAAVRSIVAFGLTAGFAVLAGQPGATLILIQQSAFVGLLASAPTPSMASKAFLTPLFPVALVVGVIEFLLLPLASGFVPFALVVGALMIGTGLVIRHRRLAPLSGAVLIYVTLLLSPSNPQSFDLGGFLNTLMQLLLAAVFTTMTFVLILPVSPKRRLYRVIAAVARDMRRTLRAEGSRAEPAVAQARLYDRLVRALTFLGRPTGARRALLSDLYRLGATDIAVHRARAGLAGLDRSDAAVCRTADRATAAMADEDVPAMLQAARDLLAAPGVWPGFAAQQAVSGLADIAFQEGARRRAGRFHRLMTG